MPSRGYCRTPGLTYGDVSYIHSDLPLEIEDMKHYNKYIVDKDVISKINKVQNGEMAEFQYVNFWRAKDTMQGPIQHLPLLVMDPNSVANEDLVTYDVLGYHPVDCIRWLHIKQNPNHKFYFYPEMTTSEVLLFKQFELRRGDVHGRMPVFHTAFADPLCPANPE